MEKPIAQDVQYWLDEISEARKREKDFRDKGMEIMDIYSGKKSDKVPFNILYSNTETLLPALYSNNPRPVVQPKFKNKGKTGIEYSAAKAAQRMLEYLIDTGSSQYEFFSDAMTDATQDALLPGRGDVSVKYEAETEDMEVDGEILPNVTYEFAYLCSNKWNRVYYGHALKYQDVPWKAYEMFIDKAEASRLFGKRKAGKLTYTEGEKSQSDEEYKDDENDHLGSNKTCLIYQIWVKDKRKVIYVSPYYKESIIHTVDDPLELSGFFDSPKPLTFLRKPNDIIPVALYTMYENQAKELNRITMRLKYIIEAVKVRGVYNGKFEEIEQVLNEDDNGLVPANDEASLLNGEIAKSVWILPVGELIVVAQNLIQARESVKRVIFEITGISDILRGQSMASETLGAQKIKESWGTMRLKRFQKDTQEFVKNSLRLLLEVACNKFSDESWVKMTGLPYLTDEQFMQAQMDLQREKMMAQQMAQAQGQGQMPPPTPAAQKAMAALEQPKWSDVLNILRDNFARSYLIDIETNSTIDIDATEDKKHVAEFMNAMAQFINGTAPMVKEGILPFDAMKSMLLAISQRFRFGNEVEEELKKMQAPKPQADPKQLQKEKQKLEQDKKTFEDNLKKYGDELDKRFMDLEKREMEFEHSKKMFEMEQAFAQKEAEMVIQMDRKEAEMSVKTIVESHKRDIQSMMDKHAIRFKEMIMDMKMSMKEEESESESED